jgi:hypothetical protein
MTTLIQPSFAKGEIAPALYGRVDVAAYAVGPPHRPQRHHPRLRRRQQPHGPDLAGTVQGSHLRAAARRVPVQDDGHLPAWNSATVPPRHPERRPRAEAAKTITGITAANPGVVTSAAPRLLNGDEVFILPRRWDDARQRAPLPRQERHGQHVRAWRSGDGPASTAPAYAAYTSGGTAARVYTIVSPYAIADVMDLNIVQSADVMTITHPSYAPRELSRAGHASWTFTTLSFAPSISAPTGLSMNDGGGANDEVYEVTALAADTLEESLATSVTTHKSTSPDHQQYCVLERCHRGRPILVYRQKNGLFGWIGDTEAVFFTDNNITPDMSISPPSARNPFNAANDYPGAVSYYQQRRVFGGTNNDPDTSFYSQVASYANMSSSTPGQDDDAITATLPSRRSTKSAITCRERSPRLHQRQRMAGKLGLGYQLLRGHDQAARSVRMGLRQAAAHRHRQGCRLRHREQGDAPQHGLLVAG